MMNIYIVYLLRNVQGWKLCQGFGGFTSRKISYFFHDLWLDVIGINVKALGDSRELQILRIVVKYADECNLFGSFETVKRLINVVT
jgi:hypothetical protein